MSMCRFCKEHGDNLLKYGVRHYAHAECGLKAQGAGAFLGNFTDWQLTHRFPYAVARRYGVAHLIDAAAKREKEADARDEREAKACVAGCLDYWSNRGRS